MVNSKHITGIVSVLMAIAVLACLGAAAWGGRLVKAMDSGVAMRYEQELFDTDEILLVEIEMEQGQWEEMLKEALTEEYYPCDVTINGERVSHVGIRPKGNTSLSAIAMDPTTDRYSFKLEFDCYVEGQSFYGLDKLILNNNYADATNMKEAIVYDMYRYLGADASLYNYAEVRVNGEYWGVYLALEAVEESFLLRNYGVQTGALYKPESMEMGGGPEGRKMREGIEDGPGGRKMREGLEGGPEGREMWEGLEDGPEGREFPGAGKGGPGLGGSGGADLRYTDDELESYSSIWEGAVTDSGKKDRRRVVAALAQASEGSRLEECLDVDNILKYMAVHTFCVNLDSLSGNMAHNYYLYEADGRLNILPWDYNLAFGGMSMGGGDFNGASEMINDAIDTPFPGTDFFDSLMENEEYRSRYHAYLRQLAEEYVRGGAFEETYARIRSQIDGLVAADPTAFYSSDEYEAGAETLYRVVLLRAESVKGQLEGAIASTDDGQRADRSNLIDASGIDLAVMGKMDLGKPEGGSPTPFTYSPVPPEPSQR